MNSLLPLFLRQDYAADFPCNAPYMGRILIPGHLRIAAP